MRELAERLVKIKDPGLRSEVVGLLAEVLARVPESEREEVASHLAGVYARRSRGFLALAEVRENDRCKIVVFPEYFSRLSRGAKLGVLALNVATVVESARLAELEGRGASAEEIAVEPAAEDYVAEWGFSEEVELVEREKVRIAREEGVPLYSYRCEDCVSAFSSGFLVYCTYKDELVMWRRKGKVKWYDAAKDCLYFEEAPEAREAAKFVEKVAARRNYARSVLESAGAEDRLIELAEKFESLSCYADELVKDVRESGPGFFQEELLSSERERKELGRRLLEGLSKLGPGARDYVAHVERELERCELRLKRYSRFYPWRVSERVELAVKWHAMTFLGMQYADFWRAKEGLDKLSEADWLGWFEVAYTLSWPDATEREVARAKRAFLRALPEFKERLPLALLDTAEPVRAGRRPSGEEGGKAFIDYRSGLLLTVSEDLEVSLARTKVGCRLFKRAEDAWEEAKAGSERGRHPWPVKVKVVDEGLARGVGLVVVKRTGKTREPRAGEGGYVVVGDPEWNLWIHMWGLKPA